MRQPFKRAWDKLVFALALTAAGLSAVWFWRQQGGIRILQVEATAPALSGSGYVAANRQPREQVGAEWDEPPPQSRGPGWIYEMLTPPVIYHDGAAGSFAITPPAQGAEAEVGVAGLELLAVRLKPYRLQLQGYLGEANDYLAVFVSPLSPGTLLARPGQRFEALGLTFKSLEVRKVTAGGGDAGPVYDVAAVAVLQDEATDAEVVLDNRLRRLTDIPLAVFKLPGMEGKACEFLEGDTFASEGTSYRITRVQLDPPEVVVARAVPDGSGPGMQVLRPISQVAAPAAPPKTLVPETTNVASHDQEIPSP